MGGGLTVSNDSGVNDEGQHGLLVGGGVAAVEERGRVVVADGGRVRTAGGEDAGDGRREGEALEQHGEGSECGLSS